MSPEAKCTNARLFRSLNSENACPASKIYDVDYSGAMEKVKEGTAFTDVYRNCFRSYKSYTKISYLTFLNIGYENPAYCFFCFCHR